MDASRRGRVRPFEVMSLVERVERLRAEGREVVSLCVGEPGGGAPGEVRRAMARVMAQGTATGYSPSLGLASLREAVAAHHRDWYGLEVPAANVAITTGSSGAFLLAFLALFDAGDRVALARPGYPAYANILTSLGLEVVELDAGASERYQPTVELLAAAHAEAPLKGLVVASPANPTGTMLDDQQLATLAAWCREHDVRLVSDEIYQGIVAAEVRAERGVGVCAWQHDRDAVVVSSFSKYWGMTGWRLGWMLVPDALVESVDALAGNLALCAPVPCQLAALEAFGPASHREAREAIDGYDRARRIATALAARHGWPVAPADGAFYLYADVGSSLLGGEDSRAFCLALLDEAGVALTPGWDFDRVHGGSTVRLSLAVGPGPVEQAASRIDAWLDARG